MAKKADPSKRLIEAALGLAAERGWHDLSLAEIAEAAGLPLAEAYGTHSSKQAILEAFSRRVDVEVLADGSLLESWDPAETMARDRLFDVLMLRFDALQPYRGALGNILIDQPRDPFSALCGAAQLLRSMAAMLEAAQIPSDGLKGALRAKGLAVVYLASLRVWLRDDSADMAKTMAALDGYLRRIEGLLKWARRPRGGAREKPA